MHQDYYSLDNGKQAVDYIYLGCLGFSYGNAFKYLVRASRKPGNSAESDLNKALTYITSSDKEYSFIIRLLLRIRNWFVFNHAYSFNEHHIKHILKAIINFEKPAKIATMIVKYMQDRGIRVNDEFKQYTPSSKNIS